MVSEPPAPVGEGAAADGEGEGEREENALVEAADPVWINYLEAQSQFALEQSRTSLEQTREVVNATAAVVSQIIELRKEEARMEHAEMMASLNIEASLKGQDVNDRRHNNHIVSVVVGSVIALVGLAYLLKGDSAFAEKILTLVIGYVGGHGHAVILQKKADDKKASDSPKP